MKFFNDAFVSAKNSWQNKVYSSPEAMNQARSEVANNQYLNMAHQYNGQISQLAILANGINVTNNAVNQLSGMSVAQSTVSFTANFLLMAAFVSSNTVINAASELMAVANASKNSAVVSTENNEEDKSEEEAEQSQHAHAM